MFLLVLLEILLILTFAGVIFYKWSFGYWERKGVPTFKPTMPFGNLNNPFFRKQGNGAHFKRLYDELKRRKWKHAGLYFYTVPVFFTRDLDTLKNILIKDFNYFIDRGTYSNERQDPLSAHLFAIGGSKWRILRSKLTSSFTSGKMKMMFQTLMECRVSLVDRVDRCYKNGVPMQTKKTLECFTTDVIGSCAFGLDCNSFKEEDSLFRRYGHKFVGSSKYRTFRQQLSECFPNISRALGVTMVPQDVSQFYFGVVSDTMKERERSSLTRKDFMQMLIDMKVIEGKLTMDELVAQCFIFFIAGFETSSTLMTFAMYEIARNQDIQQKVREEMVKVLRQHKGQITYDAIGEMKYLNQVLDETLRIYPPVSLMQRECVKDYHLPNSDLVIEKGTKIAVPILGIHLDPELYPNPDKFDPERFSDEQRVRRHQMAHIPFGEGPRMCIGMRFGLMQAKVGLTTLLTKYKFTVNSKTREPLQFDVHSFNTNPIGDVWLNVEKLWYQ